VDTMKALAEAHWSYVESVLSNHDLSEREIGIAKFHYISAFIHGYKHGVEENHYPDEERAPRVPSRRPARLSELDDIPNESRGCCHE
jgi:hypothetical protein